MWYVSYFNEKLFVTQSVQNIMQRTVQRVRCFHVSRQLFKQKSIENKASNIKAIVNQTDLPKETDAHMIRLAKLMAQKGLCSRREAESYIQKGAVVVNGERVRGEWMKVSIDADVKLHFSAQRHQQKKVTVLLNKPLGYVSSQPEKNYEPAVKLLTFENECQKMSKIRPRQPQEAPIDLAKMAVCGRLDVNSTGLLLFTQDGTIAKKILDPKGGIEKEYLVRVDRELWTKEGEISRKVEGILRTLRRGVTVDDIRYNAKEVDVINANQLRFILTEGKNRHIRKMCEKVDLKVLALKRVRIGGIKLGALPVGEWRYLQPNDKLL